VFQAKGATTAGPDRRAGRELVAKLLDATLNHRRATMKYFSMSSRREKEYVIEPYRLIYSPDGLYLFAYVPEYKEVRTFGVARIRSVSLHEERFTPAELPETIFAHSLGVHEGPPEHIEIAFEARIAPYISERTWHASQSLAEREGGGVVLSLDVSNDWALRSWILSFGPLARVLSPPALVAQIKAEIDQAAATYSGRGTRSKPSQETRRSGD
jgi:predicted DNA-binding transcriptional regulator YafY